MGGQSSKEQEYLHTILSGTNCANNSEFKSVKGGASGGNGGGYPSGDGDYLGIDSDGPKAASGVKESVIREIAHGFADILHTSKPPSNLSSHQLVKWMRENMPNPRDGRTITTDAGKQQQLCKSLGNFLTKVYPQANIDLSLSENGICSQVAEVVGTMGSGVYSEFIESATGVQRTIDNIKVIGEFVRRAKSRIMKIAEGADRSVAAELGVIVRLCDEIMKEHDRQLVILSQLTNTVVKPVTRDIVSLLKENEDFAGFVNSLKASMGTSEWGDRVSYAMAGVPNLSDMMIRTKDAAQKLNMSVRDVVNASSLKQLKLDIEKAKREMSTDMSRKAIEEMVDAECALKKAYKYRSELKEKVSGGMSVSGGASSTIGGLPTVEKRLKTQTLTRKTMLRSFTDKAHILFERMLTSVYGMSKKLGSTIPLNDDLSRFVHTFDQMGNIYKEGIEYALTGYYTHASATEQRERFIGQMQAVLSSLNALTGGQGGEYFRDIKAPLEELQKHIDFYIDRFNINEGTKIQRKFTGAMEDDVMGGTRDPGKISLKDRATAAVGKAMADPSGTIRSLQSTMEDTAKAANDFQKSAQTLGKGEYFDGDDFDVGSTAMGGAEGGGAMSKAALTLLNARRTLKHFYAIAKMRANLFKVSSESKKYNEKYETVLGDSLSKCIDKVKKDYNEFKSIIDDTSSDKYYRYMKIGKVYGSISKAVDSGNAALREWDRSVILKFKKNEVNAKIELYRALQAIDLYLMHFSDSIAANPDDIKEIAKMLDSIEIVSEWFNERSGDSVAALFEYMPFMLRRFQAVDSPLMDSTSDSIIHEKTSRLKTIDEHYYKSVGAVVTGRAGAARYSGTVAYNKDTSNGLPGNPFLVISPQRALYAQEFAKKTVERVLALKNIVAAFAYLGNKFGGETITSKVFMSPAQIYKALVTYLQTSAFTMGWDGYNDSIDNDGAGGAHNAFAIPYDGGRGVTDAVAPGTNGFNASTNVSLGGSAGGSEILVGVNSFRRGDFAATIAAAPGAAAEWTDTQYIPGALVAPGAAHHSWRGAIEAGNLAPNGPPGDGRRWPYLTYDANATDNKMPDAPPFAKCAFGCAMNSVKNEDNRTTKTVGGWHDSYAETDELFVIGIKAMVAKVFTASGLYNMFNYKSRDDHTMSSTRFVIGGNANGGLDTPSSSLGPSIVPEIIDDAVELYIRLPLLAEFYHDVFSLDESPQYTDNFIVALVPEMDPMWTGIMRHVFESPVGTGGVITKNYASRMISEVNTIYNRYKNKGSTNLVSTVVSDFIADVNSRFGIMKRNEVNQYKSSEASRRRDMQMNDDTELRDFDTLEEGEETGHAGVAPSDRFGNIPYGESLDEHEFKRTFIDAISNFRETVDKKIRHAVYNDDTQDQMGHRIHGLPNFHDQVRITKDSLKATTTPEQRFGQIFATMSGLDSATKRAEEAYLMFHETVVAPLAVLAGIQTTMDQLERTIWTNCIGTGFRVLSKAFSRVNPAGGLRALWPNGLAPAGIMGLAGFDPLLKEELPENLRDLPNMVANVHAGIIRPAGYEFPVGFAGLPVSRDSWGLVANQISEPVGAAADDLTHRSIVMLALWHEKCFKHLTQAIIAHSANLGGLVDVNASDNKIVLDHTKLQQYCEDTLGFVRRSIHKFRGAIGSETISRYEGSNHNGSIEWVQRHLIDNMFTGNNGGGLPKALKELNDSFLVLANRNPDISGQQCFPNNLNLQTRVGGGGPVADLGPAAANAQPLNAAAEDQNHGVGDLDPNFRGLSVDGALAELVYYNPLTMSNQNNRNGTYPFSDPNAATTILSGQGTSFMNPHVPGNMEHVLTKDDKLQHVIKSASMDVQNRGGRSYADANFMGRWNIYLGSARAGGVVQDGFRGDRPGRRATTLDQANKTVNANGAALLSDGCEGLMMRFNEVLSAYLENFWDQSSTKIYQPIIADFANGAANQAVMKSQGWPDLFVPNPVPGTDLNIRIMATTSTGNMEADAAPLRGSGTPILQQYVRNVGNFLDFDVIEDGNAATWAEVPGGGSLVPNPRWYADLKWAYSLGALIKTFTPDAGHAGSPNTTFGQLWGKYRNSNPLRTALQALPAQHTYTRLGGSLTLGAIPTATWNVHCQTIAAAWTTINAVIGAAPGAPIPGAAVAADFVAAIDAYRVLRPAAAAAAAAAGIAMLGAPGAGALGGLNITNAEHAAAVHLATQASYGPNAWVTIQETATVPARPHAGEAIIQAAGSYVRSPLLNSIVNNDIEAYETFAGTYIDENQLSYYGGGTPADRINGGSDINDSFMKSWIVRALVRSRNEIIKLFNNNPGYTRQMIVNNINNMQNNVHREERSWHRNRLNNLIWFRYYASAIPNDGDGNLNNFTAGPALWATRLPTSNENCRADSVDNVRAVTQNVDAIMEVITNYIKLYKEILLAEIDTHGPSGVIAAAVLSLPFATEDLQPIFGGTDTRFTPFGNGHDIHALGAGNTRPDTVRFVQSLLWAGLQPWQIRYMTTAGDESSPQGRWRNLMLHENAMNTDEIAPGQPLGDPRRLASIYGLGVMDKANGAAAADIQTSAAAATAANTYLAGTCNNVPGMIVPGTEVISHRGGGALEQVGQGSGLGWGGRAAPVQIDAALGIIIDNIDNNIFTQYRRMAFGDVAINLETVMQPVTASDILGVSSRGMFGNPREIVFASLSKAMRTMLTEQGRNNASAFLITNMSEVPSRMKEQFKANLPGFIKMFGMIHSSANVLKKIVRMGVSVQRYNTGQYAPNAMEKTPILGVSGWVDGWLQTKDNVAITNEVNAKQYYNYLLDKITTSCEGIVKCATKVLDEIGDNPLFLETHENSISDFRNTTNVTPYMPPSTALLGLQSLNNTGVNNIVRNPLSLMPVHNPSSKDFEFNYGTRLVLNRPTVQALLDHYPGMREITEQYNKVSTPEKQITLENINTFLGKYTALTRWISDVRVFSPLSNGFAPMCDGDLFGVDVNDTVAPIHFSNRPVIATLTVDAAIGLTTNSDKHGSHVKVTTHIGGADAAGQRPISRADVQVYNIIDMNVNPININALRREVPLINMLNYAYTFNSFARDMIGNFTLANNDLYDGSNNPLQNYLEMVLYPHARADFGAAHHDQIVELYGSRPGLNSNMGGHDRFALDQVLGKALFANTVVQPGPVAYVGRHGLAMHGAPPPLGAPPGAGNSLFYIRQPGDSRTRGVRQVTTNDQTPYLRTLGGLRFDTTFIRNIMFISSAHRLMRTKMSDELMKITFPVSSGPAVVNPKNTDGAPWETWEELRTD